MRDEVTTKDVLIALRTCTGLIKVVVVFNGSGDNGQIDEVRLQGLAETDQIADMPLPAELLALYEQDGHDIPATVTAFVEQWVYNQLIEGVVDFDWYNNDGGGGTITIEPYTGRIEIDAYQNITTTEPHFFDASIEGAEFTKLSTEEREMMGNG